MATLHTVNKSPFGASSLQSCLNHAKDGDAILMFEDGVYGAAQGTNIADAVAAKSGSVSLFVLKGDADARGIADSRLIKGVTSVDYAGFVELAATHDRTNNWL
jgi:tRNA 2-thiouridine synthesizing protein B